MDEGEHIFGSELWLVTATCYWFSGTAYPPNSASGLYSRCRWPHHRDQQQAEKGCVDRNLWFLFAASVGNFYLHSFLRLVIFLPNRFQSKGFAVYGIAFSLKKRLLIFESLNCP